MSKHPHDPSPFDKDIEEDSTYISLVGDLGT